MTANDPSKDRLRIVPEGSYEPTNLRTNEEVGPDSAQPRVSDARTPHGFLSIADVIEAGFLPTGDRFPIVRSGKRADIPWHVRAGVYYRDDARCQICKTIRPRPWHLDHIIPWSNGGPDTTENLRLLCEPCNLRRSNFNLRDTFAKRPVTWWCHRCYLPEHGWRYSASVTSMHEVERLADRGVSCFKRHRCRVEAIYAKQVEQGEVPTWHERGPIEALTTIAFCAHCNAPGLTDVTL